MRTQIPIPSIRATKRETTLVLAVARFRDVPVSRRARDLALRLARRFAFVLEAYYGQQLRPDERMPKHRGWIPVDRIDQTVRLRLRPPAEPAWAVVLAEHVEQMR